MESFEAGSERFLVLGFLPAGLFFRKPFGPIDTLLHNLRTQYGQRFRQAR